MMPHAKESVTTGLCSTYCESKRRHTASCVKKSGSRNEANLIQTGLESRFGRQDAGCIRLVTRARRDYRPAARGSGTERPGPGIIESRITSSMSFRSASRATAARNERSGGNSFPRS
jgi:hypothetical protein